MRTEELFADSSFVTQVQRVLRAHASARFPALRAQLDDLVSSSLQDLWRFALRRPEVFADLRPEPDQVFSGEAWDGVVRVAKSILSRRAIDHLRHSAASWADGALGQGIDDAEAAVPSNDPSMARHHLLKQMIQVCLKELARSSTAEREALWEALDRSPDSGPQADAERQRVSRLRKRLAKAIHARLGESAKSLLASDLKDE